MSQNNTIAVYELHVNLANLFDNAIGEAQQVHKTETQKLKEYTKVFKIASPENDGITLEVIVRKERSGVENIYCNHLELKNLSIEIEALGNIEIRVIRESHQGYRIEKVTFNNVNFMANSKSKSDYFIGELTLDLCDANSVDFINHCNSEVQLILKCGPEKFIETTTNHLFPITKILIRDCTMQGVVIKNSTAINHTDLKIFYSSFNDVRIHYEQLENCGHCEIEIAKSKFRELLIHIHPQDKHPDDVYPVTINIAKLILLLNNNIIKSLGFSLPPDDGYECKARIVNQNKIKLLKCGDVYPNITAWGLRERIGEVINDGALNARENIEKNKEVLVKFRQLAHDKGDRVQEATINYHVTSCDEQLISLEENKEFWQEKLIMQLGRLLSKHGTSWVRPLLGIAIFNIFFGFVIWVIALLLCPGNIDVSDLLYTIGELLNPLTTSLTIEGYVNENYGEVAKGIIFIGISFIVLIAKGFYAMCLYEFVRAARRFTIK